MMAEAIAGEGGAPYRVRASGLSFEGGNIVSDREHVFIGGPSHCARTQGLGIGGRPSLRGGAWAYRFLTGPVRSPWAIST